MTDTARFRIWDTHHGAWWVRDEGIALAGYTEVEADAGLWEEPEVELMLELTVLNQGNLRIERVGGKPDDEAPVEVCILPDCSTLSRRGNGTGGYVYECNGQDVWDTGRVPADTILAALVEECRRARMEASKA